VSGEGCTVTLESGEPLTVVIDGEEQKIMAI
jgi:hypothetical protein